VELGVDSELDGVEGQELAAVADEEDQVSVCMLGSLLTTPPSVGLARARQKNVALTILRERLREVSRPIIDSAASRGNRGIHCNEELGKTRGLERIER
jgi:hypothetical protein